MLKVKKKQLLNTINLLGGDVEETGETFEENAIIKAETIYNALKMPTVADDSGLMVDYLDGKPGVYSARYSGENATDEKNNAKLLEEMKDIHDTHRNAKFVCVICCILEDGREIIAHGECVGKIAYNLIGEGGFGYDPLFVVSGGKSFAQLTAEEKDKISHRGNALRILKEQLKKYIMEEK